MKKCSHLTLLSLSWPFVLFAVLIEPNGHAASSQNPPLLEETVFQLNNAPSSQKGVHLEVATIKESSPESTGVHIGFSGRRFITSNATLSDLLRYIFKLNAKQIESTETWISSAKYDIIATTDSETPPTQTQWLAVLQELLADRFGLRYHYDERVAPAYIIAVGHGGPKLISSKSQSSLPDLKLNGVGDLRATNATMKDFIQLFQGAILDRPIVDHTNLTGSYDFELKWTVDESQFDGRFSNMVRNQPPDENRPGLSTALTEQLGLTLTKGRENVPILVIDQVHKPTAN